MKKNIFLLASISIILFVGIISCKKNKDDATPKQITCVPYTIASSIDSTVFTFDDKNRITQKATYDGKHVFTGVTKYVYTTGKIAETIYDAQNVPVDTTYYYLNSNGTAKYSAGTYPASISTVSTMGYDTIYYVYDNNGYNTRRDTKSTVNGVITYDTLWFTFSGGNMTSAYYSNEDPITYTYNTYEDKIGLEAGTFIPGLYGTPSKNLVASAKSADNGINTNITYTFDSDGYVSGYAVTYSSGGTINYRVSKLCR